MEFVNVEVQSNARDPQILVSYYFIFSYAGIDGQCKCGEDSACSGMSDVCNDHINSKYH